MRVDIASRPQRSILDSVEGTSGHFFVEVVSLPEGKFSARIHLIFSKFAQGETITIRVHSLARDEELAKTEVVADRTKIATDEIYLNFELSDPGDILLTGHVTANCPTTLIRLITVTGGFDRDSSREDFFYAEPMTPSARRIRGIVIGTTGVCNASCLHCPTNKPSRRMPQGRMSMELFSKIVNELAKASYRGNILFGLFGEPLDDPFLVQRLKLIKEKLPRTEISIATNAGLFDEGKHSEIVDLADIIAVHVESASPEVYNRIMDPLKADRVFPRVISLIKLAQKKGRNNITLTAPIHKENILDADRIRQIFEPAGNFGLDFTPISNRAWDEGPFFEMALAPVGIACRPSQIQDQLIIDWDGAVLPCCLDFSKSMTLGNLNESTIEEVFANKAWQDMFETFQRGEWSRKSACAQCRADDGFTIGSMVTNLTSGARNKILSFEAKSFSVTASGQRDVDGAIITTPQSADGCVVYGPYIRLRPGRYKVYFSVSVLSTSAGTVLFDVCSRQMDRVGSKYLDVSIPGRVDGTLEFTQTSMDPSDLFEFRVWKFGNASFAFRGVTLVRAGDIPAATGNLNQADIDHPEGGKQMRRLIKWRIVSKLKQIAQSTS